MMRVMAVDYGMARTGVAVSDMTRTIVGETWVINCKNMQELVGRLAKEAASRNVSCIVVGYPKKMDGSVKEVAKKSENLVKMLQTACDCEITLWDERLTTKAAYKILDDVGVYGRKRKQKVDAVAAALILESYLGL